LGDVFQQNSHALREHHDPGKLNLQGILDVNNTEDPDADGAPPLEAAVRHERTLEGVGPIP
jgi:hypothetical protein